MIHRLKQWLGTVEGIQRCKRFQIDFFGTKLHSIPFKTEVMQEIGTDICSLPEVDSFQHLVVKLF